MLRFRKPRARSLTAEPGFALVSVTLVTVGVLTAVGGLLLLGRTSLERSVFQEQRTQAYYAAESGINEVLALLRKDLAALPFRNPTEYPDLPSLTRSHFPDTGVGYDVWVYQDEGLIKVVSEGWATTGQKGRSKARSRNLIVTLGQASPFQGNLVLNPSSYPEVVFGDRSCRGATESYRSSPGVTDFRDSRSYGSLTISNKNTLNLKGVDGQILCIDGDLSLGQSSELNLGTDGKVIIQVGGDLTLENSAKITVAEGSNAEFWVWGDIEMANHASLQDLGSSAGSPAHNWPRVYVKGKFSAKNNPDAGDGEGATTGADDGSRPFVFLAATDVQDSPTDDPSFQLHNKTDLNACVFAPTRNMQLDKNWNGGVRGSLVLKTLTQEENKKNKQLAQIIYRDACRNVLIGNAGEQGVPLELGRLKERRK